MAWELKKENHDAIWSGFYNFYKRESEDVANKSSFNFNVLAEQCGSIVENSHTNLLMRLLQYQNRYGYVFLESFISMAGFSITIESSTDVNFKTEYSISKRRIDGLIWQQGKFAIIIENKINHADNQKDQLMSYIDGILNNDAINVTELQIFVVFLTKDGVECPDIKSQQYLKEKGICDTIFNNSDGSEEIFGPRYFACTYRDHIYNWLKDDMQPYVPQKDIVMNAGLVQYIDFLDSMLGNRDDDPLLLKSREWFNQQVIIPGTTIIHQNNSLNNFYSFLPQKIKEQNSMEESVKKIHNSCINLLQNIIDEKNDELMKVFLDTTKDYFTEGEKPLIKEENYYINHHFTYYYIDVRDKTWPPGVFLGWSPLGLKKLIGKNDLTFYFKFRGERLVSEDDRRVLNGITIGENTQYRYVYDDKSSVRAYRINIPSDDYFGKGEEHQKKFLKDVYTKVAQPIIEQIIPNMK